jgi:hypothetical protein
MIKIVCIYCFPIVKILLYDLAYAILSDHVALTQSNSLARAKQDSSFVNTPAV